MTADTTWQARAACRGKSELFYAPAGVGAAFDFGPALAICREECTVRAECRAWAIDAGEIDRNGRAVEGVVAGVAPPASARIGRPTGPTMRRCELASCGRLFMGTAQRRYCSDECSRAAHAKQVTDSRKRAM